MEAFGVSKYIVYEPDHLYKIEKLHTVEWWPTSHRRSAEFFASAGALRAARVALRKAFKASDQRRKPRVVWVSRRGSRDRRILNEADVVQELRSRLDLDVVVWSGREGMQRAAELFGSAAVVVGSHGAGLSNMMLCQKCSVVELSVKSAQMRYFAHLAAALGFEYEALLTLDGFRMNASANLAEVVRAVIRALVHQGHQNMTLINS